MGMGEGGIEVPRFAQLVAMTKKFVWIGLFLGSTVGNLLPLLWGGDAISISGFVFSILGGIVGIWLGYRCAQSL
jgi:hypothetical protein